MQITSQLQPAPVPDANPWETVGSQVLKPDKIEETANTQPECSDTQNDENKQKRKFNHNKSHSRKDNTFNKDPIDETVGKMNDLVISSNLNGNFTNNKHNHNNNNNHNRNQNHNGNRNIQQGRNWNSGNNQYRNSFSYNKSNKGYRNIGNGGGGWYRNSYSGPSSSTGNINSDDENPSYPNSNGSTTTSSRESPDGIKSPPIQHSPFQNYSMIAQNGYIDPSSSPQTGGRYIVTSTMPPPHMPYYGYQPQWYTGYSMAHMVPMGYPYPQPVSDGEIPQQQQPQQSNELELVRQLKYYFSVDNLIKDFYLRNNMDKQGWISIDLFLNFPKVERMGVNKDELIETFKSIDIVELDDKLLNVRLVNTWDKWVKK